MIGPNGEKRPGNVLANALRVAQIATGEVEEEYINRERQEAGRKGGAARAEKLPPEKRQQIARKGSAARWNERCED